MEKGKKRSEEVKSCVYLSRFCVLFGFYSLEKRFKHQKGKRKEEVRVYVSVDQEEEVQTEKVFGDFHVCVCAPWCACVRA